MKTIQERTSGHCHPHLVTFNGLLLLAGRATRAQVGQEVHQHTRRQNVNPTCPRHVIVSPALSAWDLQSLPEEASLRALLAWQKCI